MSEHTPWLGERAGRRGKLTPAQREEIRRRLADGEDWRVLALEFKVTRKALEIYR